MNRNFLKITLRKIFKNKVYSGISILGLSLGISSCLFIAMYIFDELSFDNYHVKQERIVRLTNALDFNGEISTAVTDLPSGPTIVQDYPEVENYVRFRPAGQNGAELSRENLVINLTNVWFTDSTVFDIFSYKIINGNPEGGLNEPNSIVLTKSTAEQFFGEEDPIGQSLKINNSMLTVSAVIEDIPANSEIQVNALISMTTLPQSFFAAFNQDWFRIGFYTYLLFKDEPNIPDFEEKLIAFEEKYVQPWADANQIEAGLTYFITPLKDVHFDNQWDYDLPKGNINYIFIFSLLAIFILVIACINYINLNLAQSSKRAKEIGVRKTLGAERSELIRSFLGESIIMAVLATVVGLAMVELWLGTFNSVTGKSLDTFSLFSIENLSVLVVILLVIGIIAGSYPAFVISSFDPVIALKGATPKMNKVGGIRKTLIFVQFLFSIFMITGTILINEQMNYVQSMNLGYDRESVMSIAVPADSNVTKQVPVWIEELRNDSRIEAVSQTNIPTGSTGQLMFRIEQEEVLTEKTIRFLFTDEHFIDVLELDLLQGRNFNREITTDNTQAFIINETAMKMFNWEDEPLGKRVQWGLLANNQAANDGKVVGVIKDFHFLSLHNPLEPIILCFNPNGRRTLTVRLQKGDYSDVLAEMESKWNEIAPNHPFNFTFVDDALARNYQDEQSLSDLFNYFAIISILIASLGLFALVSFTIQGRTKEIGVRKVLGASLTQLVWVLTKDFFFILILAFAVAVPFNFYLNQKWLDSFAFDAPFNLFNYAGALTLTLVIAAVTIGRQVYKYSTSDPVDALRYE